jgi:hypothetical protein
MAKLSIKLEIDPSSLIARIEALAAHVNAAPIGDPVAELAAELGEIDASTDILVATDFKGGRVIASFEPAGNLAKLLAAFEAERGVAS